MTKKRKTTATENPIYDQLVKETRLDPQKKWRKSTPIPQRKPWRTLGQRFEK